MSNPLLDALGFDPTGQLTVDGVRYLLIRPETLVAVQREVERRLPAEAAALLADAGRAGGRLSAERFREAFPEQTAAGLFRSICELGTDAGWGMLRLIEDDPLIVEVSDGPVALAYGRADAPVCHLVRGVLAGVAEVLLEGPVSAVERTCAAAAPGPCRFVIRRTDAPVPFPKPGSP